jgi:hypothetical protein
LPSIEEAAVAQLAARKLQEGAPKSDRNLFFLVFFSGLHIRSENKTTAAAEMLAELMVRDEGKKMVGEAEEASKQRKEKTKRELGV